MLQLKQCIKDDTVIGLCQNDMCIILTSNQLFLHFLQDMEEMEKSHNTFLQGAQQELKKEMAILQKKILIDTVSAEVKEGWSSLLRAVGY